MSIEKYNPKISYEDIPYFQVNARVVQNITDLEAGFVWVYLQSKPIDWAVIKSHLQNHFKIGEGKMKKIFSYLAKHNLIEYVQEKNNCGRFGKSDIRVLNGSRFTYPHVQSDKNQQHNTAGSISVPPVSRTTGFSGLHIKENTNKRKIQKERAVEKSNLSARKKRVPLSDDFLIDEKRSARLKAVAQRVGLSESDLLAKFKACAKASGKHAEDWQAEFDLFLLRERPSVKMSSKKEDKVHAKRHEVNTEFKNTEIHSTVQDYESSSFSQYAKPEIVQETMKQIKQLLSRKMINEQSTSKGYARTEARAR